MKRKKSWGLVDPDGVILPPFEYTSGKTQEDIVNEIIEAFDDHDYVFLLGGVGTGKSAIGLEVIAYYGKAIISTPTKLLEEQYKDDYCGPKSKGVLSADGKRLDVNHLMGRTNFSCLYPKEERKYKPVHCGHKHNVCTRRLPPGITRCSVAVKCPYWSPVYKPGQCNLLTERDRVPIMYRSTSGDKVYYQADEPCPYYDQFIHFTKPGAIIMNKAKWEIETWLGRKPKVPIEIIDEGDDFLDSLTYKTSIDRGTFRRIRRDELVSPETLNPNEAYFEDLIRKYDPDGYDGFLQDEDYITAFLLDFSDMLKMAEPSDYIYNKVMKIAIILRHLDTSWVKTYRTKNSAGITMFIPKPDITLRELSKRSGKILFMSATIHTPNSFNQIFKIRNLKIINGEERFPGTLYIMNYPNGTLPHVTFRKWSDYKFRENYWSFLDDLIETATRPCLVQVHSYKYLPSKYNPSDEQKREKFWHFEDEGVRFSTKMDRGIDLRDDLCRSIIILKYPMPDISDIVLKTMRKLLGNDPFWSYLRDMADRDLVQQCGRAVRNENDWCEIYTLDAKVLERLPHLWRGRYVIKDFNIASTRELQSYGG